MAERGGAVTMFGQGMVRPGAWSLGGEIVRTAVEDLHCPPIPDAWSYAAMEARDQHVRQWAMVMSRYSTQVVLYPGTFTSPYLMSTHGALMTTYARSRIGFVAEHDRNG